MHVASMTEMRRSFLGDSASSEKKQAAQFTRSASLLQDHRAGSAKSDHAMKIQIAFNLR
jgi:hypothetical protein